RGQSKSSITKGLVDGSEIRMIENIESLGPELQFQPFPDPELPPDRHIHLPGSEKSGEIARSVPKTRVHAHEGIRVNGFAARASLSRLEPSRRLQNSGAIRS